MTSKKIYLFLIKKNLILISIKKNIKISDVENLRANFTKTDKTMEK